MLALNKIFYESFFCGTLRLRYFIFMMRKKQIDASGMDIKTLSQIFHTHRGALNMPPRAPFAERGRPRRFSFLFCFPQNKIFRASFFIFIGVGSVEAGSAFGEI